MIVVYEECGWEPDEVAGTGIQQCSHAMNENLPPEVHEFFGGSSNPIAIREYLEIKDDGEIARLAATMAKPKTFDPAALVDAAIALQDEAKAGLVRWREAMVGRMNFNTLLALARERGVIDRIHANEDDEKLSDPVDGPVLRFIQKVRDGNSAECAGQDAARIEEALASADARTKLPRPSLPCDLEAALRYAANAPDCAWPVLERAFKDFVGIYRSKREAEKENEYRTDIQEQLDRDTKVLANLKLKATSDPQLLSSQPKLEEEIKKLRERVGEWKR